VFRRGLLFWMGCGLLALFVAAAILAPGLAPHPPLLPTGLPLAPPARAHLLGTNDLGQDELSLLLYGARSTLIVAGCVTALSTVVSWLIGLSAGFFKPAEGPLMAITDLALALPSIPLYLLVLTLLGPSRRNVILVLAFLSWPSFARIVRGIVLETRVAPYVEASRAQGATGLHIVRWHLLPATLDVLPAKLILTVRFAVFAEATFAFLGLGGSSTGWGPMLNWAFSDPLLFARPQWPWLVLPPTLAIVGLVVTTAWVSLGLRPNEPGRFYAESSPKRSERQGAVEPVENSGRLAAPESASVLTQ